MRWGLVAWASLVTGCNSYEMMRVAGYLRADYPKAADVLFVVDNSESMTEESILLAESMALFGEVLSSQEDEFGTDGLADAVERYVAEVSERGRFVDVQLAVTTTDARSLRGALLGGEDGLFSRDDPALAARFNEALLCEATCFPNGLEVPSDPQFQCGDPFGEVSVEALDCVCGEGAWRGHCGNNDEEGIEAVLLAMCRSVVDPPVECFELSDRFDSSDIGSNDGLLRPDTTFIPVIVTDEGDASPRTPTLESYPAEYVKIFRAFGHHMSWAVVGPTVDARYEVECPGVTTSWGTLRYDFMVESTGGRKVPVHDVNCEPADFHHALSQVAALVAGSAASFPLYGPADVDTIIVLVEGTEIEPAAEIAHDPYGIPRFADGWEYRAEDYTVILHGDAVPTVSGQVEIYYRPAETG